VTQGERCRICGAAASEFGRAQILNSLEVDYFRCEVCGFVQTEKPYWLEQAYTHAISETDLGLITRNVGFAALTAAVIASLFDADGRFLDWGGGYGILVRLMRDRGFDFYRHDPLCENLFARGFDSDGTDPVELVTAFEVLEHLPNPREELSRIASITNHMLVSTVLLPEPPPLPGDWWYYAPEGGQHVSLYSRRALSLLGDSVDMYVSSNRAASLHLLTRSRRAARLFPLVAAPVAVHLADLVRRRRPSLLADDYARVARTPLG